MGHPARSNRAAWGCREVLAPSGIYSPVLLPSLQRLNSECTAGAWHSPRLGDLHFLSPNHIPCFAEPFSAPAGCGAGAPHPLPIGSPAAKHPRLRGLGKGPHPIAQCFGHLQMGLWGADVSPGSQHGLSFPPKDPVLQSMKLVLGAGAGRQEDSWVLQSLDQGVY